jgi:hypothetical protein
MVSYTTGWLCIHAMSDVTIQLTDIGLLPGLQLWTCVSFSFYFRAWQNTMPNSLDRGQDSSCRINDLFTQLLCRCSHLNRLHKSRNRSVTDRLQSLEWSAGKPQFLFQFYFSFILPCAAVLTAHTQR